MNGSRKNRVRRAALIGALVAVAALPASASAAKKPLTGAYSGEAVHPTLLVPTDEPYTTYFNVRVTRNVLTGIAVDVRMACPAMDAIKDVDFFALKLKKKDRVKLNKSGGFRFSHAGVIVSGVVGKFAAEGTMSASDGAGCSVSGVNWTASKLKF